MRRFIFFIVLLAAVIAGIYAFAGNAETQQSNDVGTTTSPAQESAVQQAVNDMSLRDKIASLLILHVAGTSTSTLDAFVSRYHPGGLILMEDNIPYSISALKAETNAIQEEAPEQFPLFIATDQEGCTVRRLKSDTYPCPKELGKEPIANTETAFRERSELLAQGGINLNFGIVADVTSDPKSFIFPRVFGGDPSQVAPRIAAAVRGTEGITFSTLKHFPGHGETEDDSHKTVPSVDISKSEWESRDAPSFKAGIDAGADFVMFGQLAYTAVDSEPATLSKKWHTILANELGFKGISITDDMLMLQESGDPQFADPVKNAVDALNAGNTMLLYVTDHGPGTNLDVNTLIDGIVAAVENGELPERVIDADVIKTLSVRASLK